MIESFTRSLANVLVDEGGNDDDPHDPGGRTSRGIIQREYNTYRRSKAKSAQDVWLATDQEVAEIYHAQYWNPWCDKLPAGVDYVYFDMAVNMGPAQASKLLQRGLGVADDGHIGIITMEAVKDANPIRLISDVSDRRRAFYRSLRTFKYFGRGWLARVARVEGVALKMAAVVAAMLSIFIMAGFLIGPSNAAEAKATPADCISLYFQLCPNVPQNEAAVRACIDRRRASFPPSCLELAKGFK